MSLEAVLFDKDGVLIDFQATWGRWAATLLQRLSGGDAAVYDRLADAIRFFPATGEFAADSVAIAGTPRDLAQALHGALGGAWTTADLETLLSQDAIDVDVAPPVPQSPTIEALATSGLKLGVVTNDAEDAARSQVATVGISDLFGCVVGYDSGFGAKPGPGSVLGACELLGVAPDKAAMVGDSLHDLHAARAAGTTAVGVLTGTAVRSDLAPFADVVLPDVTHVPPWVASLRLP